MSDTPTKDPSVKGELKDQSPQANRPKFAVKKNFPLTFLGKEWKDCFLTFYTTSIKENDELTRLKIASKSPHEQNEIVMQFFRDHYVEGVGYDENTKSVVPVRAEDLELLPSMIQEKIMLFLVGGVNP